jgi:CMP-N-acetylneuraminic acid synthetase
MHDVQYVAIIPARAGSRRLPGKNIRPLGGKPLICHTIEAGLASARLDLIVVSSDIPGIEDIVASYGDARLRAMPRPAELAGDLVTTEAVLLAVLAQLGDPAVKGVVTLSPTSPFRTGALIDQCIERFEATNADAAMTVERMKLRLGRFDETTGEFSLLDPDTPPEMHRLAPSFAENPAVYVTRPDVLAQRGFVIGKRNVAVEVDRITGIDINDSIDFELAEVVYARRNAPARSG